MTSINLLTPYLNSQRTANILLPANFLERGFTYIFKASYINVEGKNISNIISVDTGSDYIPAITIDGGSVQILRRERANFLKIQGTYFGCFVPNLPFESEWH
jgi:hypothetical protein